MDDITTRPANPVLAEIWRGDILESVHRGSAIVCRPGGEVVEAWGDPERIVLPRSACKMLQALPLVESGAADAAGLGPEQLALACASHEGTERHTSRVAAWLTELGLGEVDLRCGAHLPYDRETRHAMICAGDTPSQLHNNCSGKHAGFLTLSRHLGGGPDYIALDHPVQVAVRAATEEMTGEQAAGHAIDGCSAPNFAITMRGFATALARMADAGRALSGARRAAARRLVEAMIAHPELGSGPGHHTARLIRACGGRVAAKSGAEGTFAAILPGAGLGVVLKMDDGDKRGRNAAMTALLARVGVLGTDDPVHRDFADAPILNWRGIAHGHIRAGGALRSGRA